MKDRLEELKSTLRANTNLMNPERVGAWAVKEIERLRAALIKAHDDMCDISVQSAMSAVHRKAGESIARTYAALGLAEVGARGVE